MTWEDRRSHGNEDLMGVQGDVLFADPLGIRKDAKGKPIGKTGSGGSGMGDPQRLGSLQRGKRDQNNIDDSGADPLDMNLPEHRRAEINRSAEDLQEDPGVVRAWFGYLFGGGTQCCGNRDRAKDAELAKKASATGRPPTKQESKFNGTEPNNKATPSQDNLKNSNGRKPSPDPKEKERDKDQKKRDDPFGRSDNKKGGGGGLDNLHKFADNDPEEPMDPFSAQRQGQEERGREPTKPQEPPKRHHKDERSESPPPARNEKVAEHTLPRKWQWPPWTLNSKEGSIECYVTDEDSGESRWCESEPQFRVVDKEGNDAYLCAEYEWDGEFYVQDFGPHHVKKRGQDMTVFQLFALEPSAANDGLKDTSKSLQSRRGNLDDTDPFMTTRPRPESRNDTGGGVGSWLEKD